MSFKFFEGQIVKLANSPFTWKVYSHYFTDDNKPVYYLESLTTPSYLQFAIEEDIIC